MFRFRLEVGAAALAASLILCATWAVTAQAQSQPAARARPDSAAQQAYPGVGRAATDKELRAWDIDVRPDFKGLPPGSGSVAKGQDVWEAKCASCHGVFGESNEVFSPLVGGTAKDDIVSGRVARLRDEAYPQRTTLMKVASLSTLWDYINRAMPWNQPKSLSVEEVYGVTAFLLNLGGIVPDDFVLTDQNIAAVQKKMPNRNGFTTRHSMWPGPLTGASKGFDVQGSSCMNNCLTEPKVASFLPDHARGSHGNLAEQNRLVGAQRGAVTAEAAGAAGKVASAASAGSARTAAEDATALLSKHACTACHAIDSKLVGPSFNEIRKKHGSRSDAADYLVGRIKAGGSGVWGSVPMPPQNLPEAELKQIGQWLAGVGTR